ncbi:non-canonical purine NTP pyrophosphatase, partial [Nonlabens mediterrranea]|nr:non-canonical purine NTP pyrophosphatase [Nonlabens mediterrranea]
LALRSLFPSRFVTVFALDMDRCQTLFEGVCEGAVTEEYHGDQGFGYDPIFMPNGYDKTFAQMSLMEKGEISHRGIALKKLIAYLT